MTISDLNVKITEIKNKIKPKKKFAFKTSIKDRNKKEKCEIVKVETENEATA